MAGLSVAEGERETKLTGSPRVSVTEKRKGTTDERHNPEEKAPFRECTKGFQADCAAQGVASCHERWANVRQVGPAGLDPGENSNGKHISKLN
jgi:hypothetical protein